MSDPHWEKLKEIFHMAVALAPNERRAYLDRACDGNASLRQAVESLIKSHEETGFVDQPAYQAAADRLLRDQSLRAGQIIGRYRIVSLIGEGGMGRVYLAEDTKLQRKVSLKFLSTSVTQDQQQLRRFEQEARAASALNHPNIITIHEIGEQVGQQFMATEFIEGQTLRERLRLPLDLDEAMEIAIQVTSALVAAHRVNIIHRDIKPENIMIRKDDGLVKVLDFGLAKMSAPQSADPEADTQLRNTAPGVVMGTVAYMSPEQARCETVDERTDIWSLGVVLYEMVAGCSPFVAATSNEIISAILSKGAVPQLRRYAHDVPERLEEIVEKTLTKNKEERYQTSKDLLIDLKRLQQTLQLKDASDRGTLPDRMFAATANGQTADSTTNAGIPRPASSAEYIVKVKQKQIDLPAPVPTEKNSLAWLFWPAGIMVGLSLLVLSAWYLPRWITKPEQQQPALTAIPLTTDLGFEGLPSLSPDGSQVAYASGGPESDHFDIYVKQIGGGPARRLTSDSATDEFPAWSPDGRSIAFIRDRGDKLEVLLIPSGGGLERKIAEIAPDISTAIFHWTPPYLSWTPDSRYLVAPDLASPRESLSLFLFSVTTGEKRRLTTPPPTTLGDGNPAVSPDGRTLAFARILTPGHAQLHLLPLSGDYQPAGEARRLELPQPSANSPVWTADGREIVCNAGAPWVGGMLWRIAVSGSEKPQPLGSVGEGACCATISRQGNRFVYARWTWDLDIWRTEIMHKGETGRAVKLIASTRGESQPQYSPDGSKIVFASDRSGHSEIWICNGDGSNPVQLTSLESKSGSPRWFPDGRRIVFDCDKEGAYEIFVMEIATLVPRRLTNGQGDNSEPSVSHDGKWIYFGSRRTGNWEIWRMAAEGGEAVQMTHHGGEWPFESLDGKVVYYLKGQDVWQVPVSGGEETRVVGPIAGYTFAVTSEGIYFLETGPRLWLGSRGNALRVFRSATRTSERIADISLNPDDGLSVSTDGRYALVPMVDPFVCDLILVENFR